MRCVGESAVRRSGWAASRSISSCMSLSYSRSLTVGRAATCDIAIRDTYVSNVHARIYQRDGAWWLEDLGSTNGTYMNRTRVQQPTAIGPGDEVKLGKATLELRR